MPASIKNKVLKKVSVVDSPKHYQIIIHGKDEDGNAVEVETDVAAIIEAFFPDDAHISQAMKYLGRCGKKDSATYVEDVAKARWWLTRAIKFHGGHPEV